MLQWKCGGARLKELSGFSTLLKLLEGIFVACNRKMNGII